jgi:hypothetical protein
MIRYDMICIDDERMKVIGALLVLLLAIQCFADPTTSNSRSSDNEGGDYKEPQQQQAPNLQAQKVDNKVEVEGTQTIPLLVSRFPFFILFIPSLHIFCDVYVSDVNGLEMCCNQLMV